MTLEIIHMNFIVYLYILTVDIRASPYASTGSPKLDSLHLVANATRGVEMGQERSLKVLCSSLHMCTSCRHHLPLGSWRGRSGRESAAHTALPSSSQPTR